jgi:hypothetical protein
VLCEAHHLHILHNLRTLTISGMAPYELTCIFGSLTDTEPFLVYEKGVKSPDLPVRFSPL